MQQVTNARTVTHLKKKEKVVKEEVSEVGNDLIDRPLETRRDATIGRRPKILHDEIKNMIVHRTNLEGVSLRVNPKRYAARI